jgi:hypothetical protein
MRRATVEESCTLSLDDLEKDNILRPGLFCPWRWYIVHPDGTEEILETVDQPVPLERGVPGGYRVYFLCPRCGRRARNLHLPLGETRFGCRTCYNLAYQSQNEYRSIWSRLLPRHDDRPRRGPRLGWRTMAAWLELERTGDVSQVDPSLASLYRHSELRKTKTRWSHPGRPSKRAIKAIQKRERLEARGLINALGNPVPQVSGRPGRPKAKRHYAWRKPRVKHQVDSGEAYCVKCKEVRRLIYAREGVLSNGRPALKGRCQACRTRLCRMLPIAKPSCQLKR